MTKYLLAMGLLAVISPWQIKAELVIEITGGIEAAIPIAVVPFASEGAAPPQDISTLVSNNLINSGRFDLLADEDLISRPHEVSEINFRDWQLLRSENLLIGKVSSFDGKMYQVQFQLFDVYQSRQLAGKRYQQVPVSGLRLLSHQIADQVYEALTGEVGVFSTRLTFVTEIHGATGGKRYALQIADADGSNPRTILESRKPILSPSWAPDGEHLSYVSFENGKSEVFVQEIRSGWRNSVAAFEGINSAPAWSPDGKKLAITLSRSGNPEIYVFTLSSKKLSRITYNHAIDTEAVWMPNAREIIFTSDRGGSPQIYKVPVNGGGAERVTFEGSYNASPDLSSDGRFMTMVTGKDGQFYIAVQDMETGRVQVLTKTGYDESPTFAPNDHMILYAIGKEGTGELGLVSVDGRVNKRLNKSGKNVREPAWSPFRK